MPEEPQGKILNSGVNPVVWSTGEVKKWRQRSNTFLRDGAIYPLNLIGQVATPIKKVAPRWCHTTEFGQNILKLDRLRRHITVRKVTIITQKKNQSNSQHRIATFCIKCPAIFLFSWEKPRVFK